MEKKKLDVDDLAVESFDLAGGETAGGTVHGRAAADGEHSPYPTPDTCMVGYCTVVTPTCAYSECWTACEATCHC